VNHRGVEDADWHFSNDERHNQIAKTTYDEDLAEVILADELGLQEAWISENGTFIRITHRISFLAPNFLFAKPRCLPNYNVCAISHAHRRWRYRH
jgi:hypothetical protein